MSEMFSYSFAILHLKIDFSDYLSFYLQTTRRNLKEQVIKLEHNCLIFRHAHLYVNKLRVREQLSYLDIKNLHVSFFFFKEMPQWLFYGSLLSKGNKIFFISLWQSDGATFDIQFFYTISVEIVK